MEYEAVSTANETLPRAMELMARELTAAKKAGYEVDGDIIHHYDAEFNKHVLTRLIYKP